MGRRAIRTVLGWALNGPLPNVEATGHKGTSNLLLSDHSQWEVEDDFILNATKSLSVNDMKVLNVWDKSVEVVDGHYQLDTPFKEDIPNMPDDRQMAEKRLQHLIRRMKKDPTL